MRRADLARAAGLTVPSLDNAVGRMVRDGRAERPDRGLVALRSRGA